MRTPRTWQLPGLPACAALASSVLVACGAGGAGPAGPAKTLRLGYLPNITHATALVGVARGTFRDDLGATTLRTQTFDAGPAEVEALFSGDLDAAYMGPNPSINAWAKSGGQGIRILAGATSGGAALIVRDGITGPQDLKGRHLATPQLGNTQDVALRSWLRGHGLTPSSASDSGDVDVEPTGNATTLQLFRAGRLDGAWVPEPWASRMVIDGGGHVLVDERSLWPGGNFVSTQLVVRTAFLRQHPQTVRAFLEGQVDTNQWMGSHPDQARATVNSELRRLTGRALSTPVLTRAFEAITITNDPLAGTLRTAAAHATSVELLDRVDLRGIYDLAPLRAVLSARGLPGVDDAGLGGSDP